MARPRKRYRSLRILHLEDSEDDHLAVHRALAQAGQRAELHRVSSAGELDEALRQNWDVLLCDAFWSGLCGERTLSRLGERCPEVPILVVSRALGEEAVADLAGAGARDFVPKAVLARLVPAIRREVESARQRRALHRAEQAYRDLVESLPQTVVVLQRGRVVFANPALERLLGIERSTAIALDANAVDRLVHPKDRQRVSSLFGELDHGGSDEISALEFRVLRPDGEVRIVECEAWRGRFGARPAIFVTLLDVTPARELRAALIRGRVEWESVFDSVPEVIAIVDPSLRIKRLNRSLATRLGQPFGAVLERSIDELIGGDADYREATLAVQKGGPGRLVVLDSAPLGGEFRFTITPFALEGGTVHVGRDVTAEKRLDELARRRAAVENNELIFRTFRHEVGNVLNTLRVTLGVLERNFASFDDERRGEYFERCERSLAIADHLFEALRRYHEMDRVRVAPLAVAPFLRDCGELLLEGPRHRGVTCGLGGCVEEVTIAADRDALVRILLNLIDNAVAATRGRDAPAIELLCSASSSEVLMGVADNGCGIPEENLERVFSPFFSTRPRGSGMGLAVVQRLVHKMGATLSLRSRAGLGTTVQMAFPRIDPSPGPGDGIFV